MCSPCTNCSLTICSRHQSSSLLRINSFQVSPREGIATSITLRESKLIILKLFLSRSWEWLSESELKRRLSAEGKGLVFSHVGVQNNSKKVLGIRFYYYAKLERHFAIVLYTNMAREWKPRITSGAYKWEGYKRQFTWVSQRGKTKFSYLSRVSRVGDKLNS